MLNYRARREWSGLLLHPSPTIFCAPDPADETDVITTSTATSGHTPGSPQEPRVKHEGRFSQIVQPGTDIAFLQARWARILSAPEMVPIATLNAVDSPRRVPEDSTHVKILVESEEEFPPIIVHRSTMRVLDGRHRLRAARDLGRSWIAVRFFDGTEDEAFALSVEGNTRHGLPLTLSERTAAARRILASNPEWSNGVIASITALATKTVRTLRRETAGEALSVAVRVGRDGRVRPVDRAAGRLRAAETIRERPEASLRTIARVAGISPWTVRDVRERLRRGEDPLSATPRTRNAAGGESVGPLLHAVPRPPREPSDRLDGLMSDPALKYSERGRFLLRVLAVNALSAEKQDMLVHSIPSHCRSIVYQLAMEYADTWRDLARRINRRGESGTL
jgi:ParB-like chromosome segregation protein Spo0J